MPVILYTLGLGWGIIVFFLYVIVTPAGNAGKVSRCTEHNTGR